MPFFSGEKPKYWVGTFFIGLLEGINFKTSQIISSTKILSVAKGKWGPCCSTAPNGQIIVDLKSLEIFFTSGHDKYSNSPGIDLEFIIFNCEY